jgi:hypothetical protein
MLVTAPASDRLNSCEIDVVGLMVVLPEKPLGG